MQIRLKGNRYYFIIIVSTLCCVVDMAIGEWSTPKLVEGVVNTTEDEWTPFPSSDGLSLYFTRGSANPIIYQANRSIPSGPFTSVNQITAIGRGTASPWVSTDNLCMYYYGPGWKIKMSRRNSITEDWPNGTALSEINALGKVCSPTLTADELTLVFVGGDPSGDACGADLYMASRPNKDSPFGNVIALTNVNSSNFGDGDPYISPDGLNLYFSSARNGKSEIFQSTRDFISEPFGAPQRLSLFDISNRSLAGPRLSSDGSAFYFTGWDQNIDYDIYVSYNNIADLNGDGVIDYLDLAILAGQWLFYEIPADLAPPGGDGIVDFADFSFFANKWETTNDIDELFDFTKQWLKIGLPICSADISPVPGGDGIINFLDFAIMAND